MITSSQNGPQLCFPVSASSATYSQLHRQVSSANGKTIEKVKTHLQNVDAQVVIQQSCYHRLVETLKVTSLSFYLLISSSKLLEEVVPGVKK